MMADTESSFTSATPRDTDMAQCSCLRREVDFYCLACSILICKMCKFDLHSTCNTRSIHALVKDIFESKSFHDTVKQLGSLKSAFLNFKFSDRLQEVRRSQERQSAIAGSKRFKISREKTRLERELTTKITQFQNDLAVDRVYEKKDCSKIISNIEYYLDLLELYKRDGEAKKMFILLFKLKKIMPLILDIFNSLYYKQRHHLVNSQIHGTLLRYMKSDNPGSVKLARSLYHPVGGPINRISRVSQSFQISHDPDIVTDMRKVLPETPRLTSNSARVYDVTRSGTNRRRSSITRYITTALFEDKTLSEVPTQYLQLNTERLKEKRISTMKITNDGRILILDYYNRVIEMYSLSKTHLFSLKLHRTIWDFDFTTEYEILVTCPYDGILQYIQFTDEDVLFETSFLQTEKGCKAICCFPNRLFVSYTGDNPCIRFLSKDGIVYRTLYSFMNDTLCLLEPLHMHVSTDRKYIVITDHSLQRITVLNQQGEIVRSHDTYPGYPFAMTTDREENVLVSIAGTNEIRMISRDGQRSRTLVGKSDIVGQPSAVAFKPESKLLLVAFDAEATVKMFHII